MPSSAEFSRVAAVWNRRLHYYIGLYLLFFLWLFCFTGLILNHPQWTFAEFWPQRVQTTYSRPIQAAPPPGNDLVQARDVMRQLGIEGEIEWTKTRGNSSQMEFRVTRPGRVIDIAADFGKSAVSVQQLQYNGWGIARLLHTFTGVRFADARNTRDWSLTTLWVFCMDALAAGLILMVLSSLWLWWNLPHKRTFGWLALAIGVLTGGLFVFGLRWIG